MGKLVLESGYKKGEWKSQHRRKVLEAWQISQQTFSRMIILGEMSDEEFTHAMSKFGSIDAWVNSQRNRVHEITESPLV
jgi:hypothetical protein